MRTLFSTDGLRHRVSLLYIALIGANVLAWVWAFWLFADKPLMLSTCMLAYTFGLRHAVDADHIAAIDNVTRKLMQQGQKPLCVGLFFSLGHASIIMVFSVIVGFAARILTCCEEQYQVIGGLIGTIISASFLLILAIVNMMILIAVWRSFAAVKRGEPLIEEDLDILLNNNGFITRMVKPLFRIVTQSWHMFPIGLLFGLGFDTATEVALFGISASQASQGASLSTMLVFPVLFTVGMAIVDATDGILMVGAYGWAFKRPIRKLYYNLTITAVSVIVALVIGGVETLGLIGDQFHLEGTFWQGVGIVNENFGLLGYGIIGIFIIAWAASYGLYRLKGYDELDVQIKAG